MIYVKYNQISRKGENLKDKENLKVALANNVTLYNDFINTHYKDEQILWYSNMEECLNAVVNGDADIAIANNYVSAYFLSMYRYGNLTQCALDSGHELCFAVYGEENELILSAINKSIDSMSQRKIEEIIISESARQPIQGSMDSFIYGNTNLFIVIIISIIALFVITLIFAYTSIILRKNNKKLQFATEAKSSFISRISHDMRTPMNSILGIATLSNDHITVQELHEDMVYIKSAGKMLLGLINDTLDIFKIENNKMELYITNTKAKDMFEQIIQTIKPLMDEKEISFNFEYSDINWITVCADEKRVQQIFLNLLSNSVKFTHRGGKIDVIIERIQETTETVTDKFTVKDNGIGMTEEFQKHIFDAFSQENRINTDNVVGTGLGLSIVKRIVDLMGGIITVKSRENEGTEISITLTFPISKETEIEEIEIDFSALSGKRVLLCEDHPMNIKIAEKIMEKKEIIVDIAENGKIGLDKFTKSQNNYYDAILMDIRMPIMDGLTATEKIRKSAHPQSKSIPIIAMSANALLEDVELSKSVGMNEHLSKPIEPDLLYKTLWYNIFKEEM